MPPSKRVAKGIYRDSYGLRAVVNTVVGRKEKRFPADADVSQIQLWRTELAGKFASLKRRRPDPLGDLRSKKGTLSADVAKYLDTVTALASWKSLRSELKAWEEVFGAKRRHQITEDMCRRVIADWRDTGRNVGTDDKPVWKPFAAKTCEHRVRALRAVYHHLDGDDWPTPLDRIHIDVPPPRPVYVQPAIVARVAAKLRHAQTRARLLVLATTGVRPAELMRAEPKDVHLKDALWWVRTAKGGYRPPLHLNDEMQAALKAFDKAKAWGAYDTSEHAKRLYLAGWPRDIRPYSVRASFGMALSMAGVDLGDIGPLMGHKPGSPMTRLHYVPPVASRLRDAVTKIDQRFTTRPAIVGKKRGATTKRS